MGGLMSVTGLPDGEPGGGPVKVGVAVTDLLTGMYAATAILAALAHRDRSGKGQHVDLALLDVQVAKALSEIVIIFVRRHENSGVQAIAPSFTPCNTASRIPIFGRLAAYSMWSSFTPA
jgi:crotonobetainyl-CoA:carnitine CoA-transferase CaiB-like acyl-CoA transferase